jgi:hypothetical protein
MEKVDNLDQDKPIRGQKYVCISFISPEKVLKDKAVYQFEKFVQHFSSETRELFISLQLEFPEKKDEIKSIADRYRYIFEKDALQEEYRYYLADKDDLLNAEFNELCGFQTSVRGFKVRGSYDTLREAQVRAEFLKRSENSRYFIYIAEVGCWCPWDPNPDNIEDQQYNEDKLNQLMAEYKKNQAYKDQVFDERKSGMIGDINARNEEIRRQNARIQAENELLGTEKSILPEIVDDEGESSSASAVAGANIFGDSTITDNVGLQTDPAVTASIFDGDNISINRV